MREARTKRGVATPEGIVRSKKLWPALPQPEEAAAVKAKLGGPERIRLRTVEEGLAGIRIYAAEHLAPGEPPRQRHYLAACKRDNRLVWPGKLKKLTGKSLIELCAELGL
jgi:hypothetical protein